MVISNNMLLIITSSISKVCSCEPNELKKRTVDFPKLTFNGVLRVTVKLPNVEL